MEEEDTTPFAKERGGGVDISSLFFKLINCPPSGFGKCKFALSSSSDRKRQVCRVHGVRFPFLLGISALLLYIGSQFLALFEGRKKKKKNLHAHT